MLVKKAIEKLEATKEFKKWREKHKTWFLAHVLIMIEPGQEHLYDIGFYGKKEGLMTTFLVDKECKSLECKPDQKVFKDPAHEIQPLDISRVATSYEVAIELAGDLQKTKYKAHVPVKEVVLLQNIKEGQVWNITFVTQTFKTLNIKVDAGKPEIASDKLVELFQIDK